MAGPQAPASSPGLGLPAPPQQEMRCGDGFSSVFIKRCRYAFLKPAVVQGGPNALRAEHLSVTMSFGEMAVRDRWHPI